MDYSIEFKQKNSRVSEFKRNKSEKAFKLINRATLPCKNINKVISSNSNLITIENFFNDTMIVRDVYRYKIKIQQSSYPILVKHSKNEIKNSKFNDLYVMRDKDIDSIVLLLESPHKDEYLESNQLYIPISPAQKKTGDRIENNICILINELISNPKYNLRLNKGEYRIIICNPIQYQTSLYYLYKSKIFKKLRDDIWSEIFNQPKVQDYFLDRINTYKPKLILNGCTKGCSEKINNFIKGKIPGIKYYETSHPFSWSGFNIK